MFSKKRLLLAAQLLVLSAVPTIGELIKCADNDGCQVRLWDPTTQSWGEPEPVPEGTIVSSDWAIGWGAGWQPV